MATAERAVTALVDGERLTRDEFLARWDALPELRSAELLEGEVYLSSPVRRRHGSWQSLGNLWLRWYAAHTPGCESALEATWHMGRHVPQPDGFLRIRPDHGGQSWDEGDYCAGGPELAYEVALATAARDRGPRRRVYRAAGVQEYVAVLGDQWRVLWLALDGGDYVELAPDANGLLRSRVFPGLWLDPAALLSVDDQSVIAALQAGLASPEHAAFVERLARQRR